MTKGELKRREQAVIAGFVERDLDNAIEAIDKILKYNIKDEYVYRFRGPKDREIDILEKNKIFLCKPSVYPDTSDCEILLNLKDLAEHVLKAKYKDIALLLNKDSLSESVASIVQEKEELKKFIERIRDQALVTCFSEAFNDTMWKKYAHNYEGICIRYNIKDIMMSHSKELRFFPVRYVNDRKHQKDILFDSKDYFDENPDNERQKYLLSCFTKEYDYQKEREWRLFGDNKSPSSLKDKGKEFDFDIKPVTIFMGKRISENPTFESKVKEYASKHKIELIQMS